MAGTSPRLSGTVSQGELELGQRRRGEISLPPLDSADKGWYLDAMKEGVSDRCEEVRRGFLRFGSIVQQLEQQIGNDGGSNLKPDGVGRAAMASAGLSRSLVNSLSVLPVSMVTVTIRPSLAKGFLRLRANRLGNRTILSQTMVVPVGTGRSATAVTGVFFFRRVTNRQSLPSTSAQKPKS